MLNAEGADGYHGRIGPGLEGGQEFRWTWDNSISKGLGGVGEVGVTEGNECGICRRHYVKGCYKKAIRAVFQRDLNNRKWV